jgi:hypothetical protein
MCSSLTGFRWHSYRRQAVPQLRNDLGRIGCISIPEACGFQV